jgi:hypothetical protein
MHLENKHRNRIVAASLLLAFFSIPHLIDDFLFGVPQEFGLSVQLTQVLGGAFIVLYMLPLVFAARGRKSGYAGMLFWGIFLTLAGILKHIPRIILPGPYWSGWFSEGLIYGLIASGLILALVSLLALRSFKK